MKVKSIAIIVIHFKNLQDTIETLDSLYRANLPKGINFTVYLVNNDSKNKAKKKLTSKFPRLVYLQSPSNLGFSGGNNLGLKQALKADHDTFILLNNDTIVSKDFFQTISSSPITQSNVGVVGGLIYFASGFEFKAKYKKADLGKIIWFAGGQIDWANVLASHQGVDQIDRGKYSNPVETDFVTGALLITKREILEKIGLLDDKYFLYLEDADFCVRARRKGFKIIFDPNIKIHHKVAQSSGIGSSLNDYFITRNRLLFGFKYAKSRAKFALIREAFRKLFTGTKAQKTAIKDFFTLNLDKGSWIK